MQLPNASQDYKPNDQEWHFLVEYSLSELLVVSGTVGDGTYSGLYHIIRDLGVAPECIQRLARTLPIFAQEAIEHSKQGCIKIPIHIRLFCQEKTFEKGRSANTLKHTGPAQTIEPEGNVNDSFSKATSGWGYFIIERCEDFPPYSSTNSHNYIDVYVYKEGE